MIITRSIPYPSKRKKKKLHRRFQRNGVEHWPDVDTKVDVEQTVVDCFSYGERRPKETEA